MALERTSRRTRGEPRVVTRWLRTLSRYGFQPALDRKKSADGLSLVRFEHEGACVCLVVQEYDPTFFHLFVTYSLDDPEPPPLRLLEVANDVNQELKGVKVTVRRNSHTAIFGVEGFSTRTPQQADLERALVQVSRAANRFFGLLRWTEQPMASA